MKINILNKNHLKRTQVSITEILTPRDLKFWRRKGKNTTFAISRPKMVKNCMKMETTMKLNLIWLT